MREHPNCLKLEHLFFLLDLLILKLFLKMSDSDSDFDDDAMTLIAFSFCEILNPIPVVQVHYNTNKHNCTYKPSH